MEYFFMYALMYALSFAMRLSVAHLTVGAGGIEPPKLG